ncbi:hypothetical protein Dsin_020439 [Dipteronia sinensis]|uniref:Uncharacterized protein n=1 Tax=Dipteronia sinensis TaxID=43782 RepID=A0AAE0AAD3_9ROSI|nr:hypothetical protein Dsin_020439 [Dipteronia sinensis]
MTEKKKEAEIEIAAFKLRGAKAILSFPLEAGKCEARTDEGACGRKRVRGGENEEVEKKRKVKVVNTRDVLLMPSSFTGFWDCSDVNGIYNAPPLSPLSPHPVLGYPQLMVL